MQKITPILSLLVLLPLFAIADPAPFDPRAAAAQAQAAKLITQMTLEEKVLQLLAYKPNGVPRLGIPNLEAGEVLHGVVSDGATVFPQAIALGSTWDPDTIGRMANVIAQEARAVGLSQAFSPMLGLARDPRWGRVEESYGEDPYLVSRLGVAFISNLQGLGGQRFGKNKIISTAKHYVADGEPWAGANGEDIEVSERVLRENFMQPFEAAVTEAQVGSVMPAHHAINGVPCHANVWLIDTVLRKQWGFQGFTTSDMGDVPKVGYGHLYGKDEADTALKCFKAGVDMELVGDLYMKWLPRFVPAGVLTEDDINRAAARVIAEKIELLGLGQTQGDGLSDDSIKEQITSNQTHEDVWAKLIAEGKFTTPGNLRRPDCDQVLKDPKHDALALEVAQKAIVLLKNQNNVLPLKKEAIRNLLLVGQLAKSVNFGGYSNGSPKFATTIFDGLNAALPPGSVQYVQGATLNPNQDNSTIAPAVAAAANADVIVCVVGHTNAQACENLDRQSLDLPGNQEDLVEAMQATGKPVVVVLVNGAPLIINWINDHVPAIVEDWYGGQAAGTALAQVLFGDVNPGGKLPVTFPKSLAQIPCYYNHDPLTGPDTYYDNKLGPTKLGVLYPFGFGLSYTTFAFSDLGFSAGQVTKDNPVTVTCKVANTGQVVGDEVVQLYVRQDFTSLERPVLLLRGFQRVTLQPGESRELHFPIGFKDYKFWKDGAWVSEPGQLNIMIGSSSADLPLRGSVQIQ
jgi:beta-glucosidase